MKRSREETAATRRHIVETAAEEFRNKGLSVGVADLMSTAGLTHGGFYRHFESKDELIGEACVEGMRALIDSLEAACRGNAKNVGLKKVIQRYLSTTHRDNFASGCPLAALGTELVRSNETVRARIVDEANRLVRLIASQLNAQQYENVEEEALSIVTSMLGTVILARLLPNTRASTALLRNTADRLIEEYCP